MPVQDLAAVRSAPEKNKQVPAVRIGEAECAYERKQAIVAAAHVDRLGGQPNLDAGRKDHALSVNSARATAATYAGDEPLSKRKRSGPTTSSSPGLTTSGWADTRTGRSLGAGALRGSRCSVLDQYERQFALNSRSAANSFIGLPLARHSSTRMRHSARLRRCALWLRFMLRQDRRTRSARNRDCSDGYLNGSGTRVGGRQYAVESTITMVLDPAITMAVQVNTMPWNERSRWSGLADHDAVESVATITWRAQRDGATPRGHPLRGTQAALLRCCVELATLGRAARNRSSLS